ncbi:hypothetical protein [Endozoicomonas elysicola]|uniref:hypothetical protein n=1 Tax=Endozoicomonas elysicola TaxID=305900 RepID=UPI001267C47F|nr:hypothetical protein [Endozoicomonas elysicola]
MDVRNILKAVQDQKSPGSSLGALMIKVVVVPEWPAILNEKYEAPLSAGANAPGFNDEGAAGGCMPLGKYDVEGSYEDKLQLAIKESLRFENRGL